MKRFMTFDEFAKQAAYVKNSPIKKAATKYVKKLKKDFRRIKLAEPNNPRDLEREIKAREEILEKIKVYSKELEKNHPIIYTFLRSWLEEVAEPMEAEVFTLKIKVSLSGTSGAGSEQIMK